MIQGRCDDAGPEGRSIPIAPGSQVIVSRSITKGVAMLIMITAKYPATSIKRLVELSLSPETPKRPDAAREVSSFVHGDHSGYTNYFVFDVDDTSIGEVLRMQGERAIYLQTRVPGLTVDIKVGQSVQNAINTALPHLAQ
jgi:hypothetical protein